jgi:hypothetical protein
VVLGSMRTPHTTINMCPRTSLLQLKAVLDHLEAEVLPAHEALHRDAVGEESEQPLLRQYVHFCTSKTREALVKH